MKTKLTLLTAVYAVVLSIIVNSYVWLDIYAAVASFLLINLLAGTMLLPIRSKRLKLCCHGAVLLMGFCAATVLSLVYHTVLAFFTIPHSNMTFVWSGVFCACGLFILFWNGMLCVYFTSVQLGVKERVLGLVCGMLPVLNLIMLVRIIRITCKEVLFEQNKEQINAQRKQLALCKTKYPIVMVHGVFFRDSKYFNYWGRIPKELEENGASVYYGNHQSASSIADSAGELTERIKTLTERLQCEKVNIIAHSKGGLDCRYAMAKLGLAPYVASLTTINTPHRGCLFADYLLAKIPVHIKQKVAEAYNETLKKFGDTNPDFLAAVNDLTNTACTALNEELTDPEGVFCQSVGSLLEKAVGGKFPLNLSYPFVYHFDGPNDGLVSEQSFEWGERYTLLKPKRQRGISHGDMIDLNRQNIDGFDVREFYVGLVNDLKNRNL